MNISYFELYNIDEVGERKYYDFYFRFDKEKRKKRSAYYIEKNTILYILPFYENEDGSTIERLNYTEEEYKTIMNYILNTKEIRIKHALRIFKVMD